MEQAGYVAHPKLPSGSSFYPIPHPDELAEFAGRLCYQSWSRPNPDTATNDTYLAHILEQGHESVLEHSSATLYVAGVSRSLSHELVRHRHLSFSQLSQRFVDESSVGWVNPPAVDPVLWAIAAEEMHPLRETYRNLVTVLMARGLSRKQAREAARAVLPNATETRFVVTGNMRAWRDVLRRRLSSAADAEIQEFARLALGLLQEVAPGTFQDFAQPKDYEEST